MAYSRGVSAKPYTLWVTRAAIALVLLAALALRLEYAFDISPYSDEYITMLAARAVLQTGVPILPSGLFYDHGLLFVYVDALFLGVMGFSVEIARMASVFIGVLSVAVVYVFGRRWFSTRAGLFAAVLLATATDAIAWHGRARMYSLLQLAFVAGALLLYEGFVRRDSRRYRCVGIVAISAAALTHLLAVPYTLTMVVALVGVRWWVRRRGRGFPLQVRWLWPELLLATVGLVAVVLTRQLGGSPWRAGGYIVKDPDVLLDAGYLLSRLIPWYSAFVIWPNLVWATVLLADVLALLLRLARKSARPDDAHAVYLLVIWLGTVTGLAIFSVWFGDSYTLALLPMFHLLSAKALDVMCGLVQVAMRRARARRVAQVVSTAIVLVVMMALVWPGVRRTVTYDPLQLDKALEYVRLHQREDDVIAAFAPHAALLVLGRVDYYAQEHGYPSIEGESGRVDIWTGTPVLDSVEELTAVLDAGERVWLIVHRENWQRHYTDAYREVVDARMERVFDGTGTLVYFMEP